MQRVWSTYLDNVNRQGRSGSPHMMDTSPRSSRPASVSSHANSAYSHAASTRHMLSDSNSGPLDPPAVPFAGNGGSMGGSNDVSLTVNYLPAKFSSTLLSPGGSLTRKRRGGKNGLDPIVPKRGGGVEAFKSGEARMPGQGDDDYDGVQSGWFGGKEGGKAAPKRLRWNRFKWILFFANVLLTLYSLVSLVFCLLTWFNVWTHADTVRVGNRPELVVSTLAASFGVMTSVVGWAGILLNNRSFLAIYTFFLWITFAFLVVPGYISYRRQAFNLEGKINAQWSRQLGADGRARIQNQLQCCGYFSPFVEATVTQTCYARSVLEGCKKPYMDFERIVLTRWYTAAFAIAPFHILVILAGLLCSNHVTYRFGKGMMPKAYRLSLNSMAVIMDNYANQLAEQYGSDVASEVLAKSRSNLHLDAMQPMTPYNSSKNVAYHAKYDSVGSRAPDGAS